MSNSDPKQGGRVGDASVGGSDSSLTGRRGLSGRFAAEGFAYQARYIVARIPDLLANSSFEMLLHEGAEDVDIRYAVGGQIELEAIQVKGYSVDKTHLAIVLENFARVDENTRNTYVRFILACQSLNPKLQNLASKLVRYRGAKPLYEGKPEAIRTTLNDLKVSISKLGLAEYETLILEKVYLSTDLAAFSQDNVARNVFTAELQKLKRYESEPIWKLERVYEKLKVVISNSQWQTLDRAAIESAINEALRGGGLVRLPMPKPVRRDLWSFVNRDNEIKSFRKMLEADERPIMLVSGGLGIGKSELIQKMLEQCDGLNITNAVIVWNDLRFQDYFEVMGKVRDEIGKEHFEYFSELAAQARSSAPNTTETDAVPGVESEEIRNRAEMLMAALTDAFIPSLGEATLQRRAVLFFDDAEKMSEETRDWVWGELFQAGADGRLPNVRFVLCTERQPADLDQFIGHLKDVKLRPFEHKHIVTYLKLRFEKEGIQAADTQLAAWADGAYLNTDKYPARIRAWAYQLIDYIHEKESVR